MTVVHLPKFRGTERRSLDELETYVRMMADAGYDPVAVGAMIEIESAGTWSPSVKGPAGTFKKPPGYPVGLIQFSPDTAARLGASTAELERMSFVEQLPYVVAYFTQIWGGPAKFKKPADYYAAGWGNGVGAGDDFVLAVKGQATYTANPLLDVNGDEKITMSDLTAILNQRVNAASKRGYLEFDLSADTVAKMRARYQVGPTRAGQLLLLLRWSR